MKEGKKDRKKKKGKEGGRIKIAPEDSFLSGSLIIDQL